MLGRRGLTVLSLAGAAGVILGVLGWTQRGTGLVGPLIAASSAPAAVHSPPSAASPSAAARAGASPSAAADPSLASQPYASYAYRVWPGPLTANARLALAGFSFAVTRQAGGITLSVVVNGEKVAGASRFYPGGAKVYVVDSSLGDEGGSIDYSLADDGLIVTNARGQMLP